MAQYTLPEPLESPSAPVHAQLYRRNTPACDRFPRHLQSEGNLVHGLDKRNPVALLVSAIEESVLLGKAAKDDEFYLGAIRDGGGKLSQVHHIMSGGPSRGIMVLETETAPGEGTTVQLFHRPSDVSAPPAPPHAAKNTLTFVATAAALLNWGIIPRRFGLSDSQTPMITIAFLSDPIFFARLFADHEHEV